MMVSRDASSSKKYHKYPHLNMFTSNCHFHSTSQLSLSSHNKNIKQFLTIKSKFQHIVIIFLHNQCTRYESDSKLNILDKWQIILSICFVCFDVNLNLIRNKFFVHPKYMGKLNLSKRDIFSYDSQEKISLLEDKLVVLGGRIITQYPKKPRLLTCSTKKAYL